MVRENSLLQSREFESLPGHHSLELACASKLLHRGSRHRAEIKMLSYLETHGNTREDDLRSVETYFCMKKGRVLLATSIVMLATGFLSSIN